MVEEGTSVKYRVLMISVVLVMSVLALNAGYTKMGTPPYLDGSKTSAPPLIYAVGKGIPDKAEVNITIFGAGDPIGQVFAQDVVFLIDSSGSMEWADPSDLRLEAAKYYVDLLDPNMFERAAVVDFDEKAKLVTNHHLSTDYDLIKDNIDSIDSWGGTNIPSAMVIANRELINYGWSNHTWIAILLTDGQNWCQPHGVPCPYLDEQMDDPSDPLVKQAIDNNITYFTIGLGDDVNATLLSSLANHTGGTYHPAADPSELEEIYDQIHKEIISIAGRSVTVTETLKPEFEFVNGSFSQPPTIISGNGTVWEIPSLSINESWTVTFEVQTDVCGDNMQIDYNTTVAYTSYTNKTEYLYLLPVYVDVIGCYTPPVADAGGPYLGVENTPITLNASGSFDPDGSIVSYEWDLDMDGLYDDASGEVVDYLWNDDYESLIRLRVTDDSNLSATDNTTVTVMNIDPSARMTLAPMSCGVGLRVAGSKWSNVNLTLYEDGIEVGFIEVERWPGDPDKNPSVGSIPSVLNLSKSYQAVVQYDPYPDDGDEVEGDQGNNGKDKHNNAGNPVWLTLDCDGGSKKIHHTFNTQQSKKRDSDHPNHVEPWIVDVDAQLIGFTMDLTGYAEDPGSDDLTFLWEYGSQTESNTHLNGAGPDPYFSPLSGTAPVEVSDYPTLTYEGPGTITLTITDDDEGKPTDTLGTYYTTITI